MEIEIAYSMSCTLKLPEPKGEIEASSTALCRDVIYISAMNITAAFPMFNK